MRYFAALNIMALNGSEIIDRETYDGGVVRGVFIPLDENGLRYYAKGNILNYYMDMVECRPNPDGVTHHIKPYVRKKDREAFKRRYGNCYIGKMQPKASDKKRLYSPDVDAILGLREVDMNDPKYSIYRKLKSDRIEQKMKERAERKARRAERRAERERRRQEKLNQQQNGSEKE